MANRLYDKNYAKAVSYVFTEKMTEKNVSIENIAIATGVKYNTMFRYLNGSRHIPIDLFQKLCDCLDLDFVEIFRLVNEIATKTTLEEYQSTKHKEKE